MSVVTMGVTCPKLLPPFSKLIFVSLLGLGAVFCADTQKKSASPSSPSCTPLLLLLKSY